MIETWTWNYSFNRSLSLPPAVLCKQGDFRVLFREGLVILNEMLSLNTSRQVEGVATAMPSSFSFFTLISAQLVAVSDILFSSINWISNIHLISHHCILLRERAVTAFSAWRGELKRELLHRQSILLFKSLLPFSIAFLTKHDRIEQQICHTC